MVFFAFSLTGYASTRGLFNQTAPMQSYQSAKTTSKATAPAPKATDASQMAKVKSIMAKSKKTVQSGSNTATGASRHPAIKLRSEPSSTTPHLNSQTTHELESQMTELNQVALMYQQNTNQKIENLRSQNRDLQSKLKNLTEALMMINQQLSQITHTSAYNAAASAELTQKAEDTGEGWSTILQKRFQGPTKYFAFAVLLLLLLLMAVLIKRSPKQ